MSNDAYDDADGQIRPLVAMRDAHLRAEPGQYTVTSAEVRNPGAIVETYDMRILGPAGAWVDVSPPFVSLFPGDSEDVTVTMQPPLSSRIVAGTYIIGVQATSQVRPEVSTTAELTVDVPPFYRFRCYVAQSSFTVRTKATMLVQIANEGNSTATFSITAEDPEGYLKVEPASPTVTLAPGQSQWVEIHVKVAPKLVGSSFDTHSFMVTVLPIHDVDLDLPILDVDAEVSSGGIAQKPFIRLRLGALGRLIILLTILGLIAGFFISRWIANNRPPTGQSPPVPLEFEAELGSLGNDVILTWAASPGATGYTIYAVGATGDPAPTPTPTPTIIVQLPGGGAVGQAAPALRREGELPDVDSPVCEDCSAVAQVVAGVTRFVVENVPPGQACYRIAATLGETQSLFSTPACTIVPDPALRDDDGNGIPDAQEQAEAEAEAAAAAAQAAEIRPCPPVRFSVRPVSPTSVAVLWRPATEPPKGFRAPEGTEIPAVRALEEVPMLEPKESVPLLLRGGGGPGDGKGGAGSSGSGSSGTGGSASGSSGSTTTRVCDPEQEISAWTIQRRIFSGWSNVTPGPAATDTAFEITGLEPSTQYCFRMRATGPQRTSRYTERVCTMTDAVPILVPVPPAGTTSGDSAPAPTSAPGTIIIDDLAM
jgi:uncharacterized membrane protein YgcG